MDKQQRNYQLFIEEGHRTFAEVKAGVPAEHMIKIDSQFTLEFDCNRTILSSANTSSFKVYNLSKATRTKIYKDRQQLDFYKGIELRAGYGDIMPTIFKGNIHHAWGVREGVNFITKIDAYDGGFAFLVGNTARSYEAGTPTELVLKDIINDLGAVNKGAVGNYPTTMKRGNTVSGNSADLLNTMTNGGFFVDLEKAHCLNEDECILGSIAVINSASGLLGTPIREETYIGFDMIFEPRMLIGQAIQLQSITADNFNGPYKVVSMHHHGMISDSVCGSAITSVGLLMGIFKTVSNV